MPAEPVKQLALGISEGVADMIYLLPEVAQLRTPSQCLWQSLQPLQQLLWQLSPPAAVMMLMTYSQMREYCKLQNSSNAFYRAA